MITKQECEEFERDLKHGKFEHHTVDVQQLAKEFNSQVAHEVILDRTCDVMSGKAHSVVGETGANNGTKNSFYSIPDWVADCDLLAEYLELDPYEFNVLKTLWIHKGARHNGTNDEREINKRLHYAERSKAKMERVNENVSRL